MISLGLVSCPCEMKWLLLLKLEPEFGLSQKNGCRETVVYILMYFMCGLQNFFQNVYAVVFGNIVPFSMYLIVTAEIKKCMGSVAPSYTPEVTSSQNSPLLHDLCCRVWTTVVSYRCKCSGFVAFCGSTAHTLLVLQIGLNISFEMSPTKHQISFCEG